MNGYYELVVDQLRKNGYHFHRQGKGAHEIWCKGNFCVAVSFNCKSRFTANQIMKDAKIKHHF